MRVQYENNFDIYYYGWIGYGILARFFCDGAASAVYSWFVLYTTKAHIIGYIYTDMIF